MASRLLRRVLFGRRMAAGALPALLDGSQLRISSSDAQTLIGGSVWPLAAALCHHLLANRRSLELAEGVSTLELGAGTGAVGIYAATLGARCTLTDMQTPRASAMPVSYSTDGSLDLVEGQSRRLLDLIQFNADANHASCTHHPAVRFFASQSLKSNPAALMSAYATAVRVAKWTSERSACT